MRNNCTCVYRHKKGACGENNHIWKGDGVGYHALHNWIRRHKSKPSECEICKKADPVEVANISGKYKRDVNDFLWLCRKCHFSQDGRAERSKGSKNSHARLTEDQVKQMRNERSLGASLKHLGEKYGVAYRYVSVVCTGRTWRHI